MTNKRKINDDVIASANINNSQKVLKESQELNICNEKRKRISNSPTQSAFQEKRFSSAPNDLSFLNDLNDLSQNDKIKAPCAGVIQKIHLKNFKCHSELDFNLHPYINFIIGRNGSGKSAVMDAIILCLGGRAGTTGRQANAKTFIKTNSDKAELSLTLSNIGEEAYKPHEYGSSITIERKINKDGVSNYRLLNDKKKLVSTKKKEVDNIRENFNIQIENPVCFLNQETSKHFLNSSNIKDKYQFFMKASQIDSIKRLQEEVDNTRQSSLRQIEDKESQLPKLEEDLYKLEVKYKKCQSVDKLRRKLNSVMQEYAWAVVIDGEKVLRNCEDENKSMSNKQEKIIAKITEIKGKISENEAEYKEIKSAIGQLSKKSENIDEEDQKAQEEGNQVTREYQAIKSKIKQHSTQIERKQLEYKKLQERLQEETSNTAKDYEEEKAEKEAKIEGIKQELLKNSDIEKFKLLDNQMYKTDIDHAQKIIREKIFDIKNFDKLVQGLQDDIHNLQRSEQNRIYKFGQNIAELVADVDRHAAQGKFKYKPKGPLGMFIDTRDFSYSLAIEACLGSLLNSFVCQNYEDEQLLYNLIRKHIPQLKSRPRVHVIDFLDNVYDTRMNRPNTEYPTVLDMLKINDPTITNVLIDQRQIECILLLPDRSHASIIEKHATANCKEAFLLNGDHLLGLPSFRMYANREREVKMFVQSTHQAIEQKKQKIIEIEQPIPSIKQEIDQLNQKINKNQKLKYQNDKQLEDIQREQHKLQQRLKQAEAIQLQEPLDVIAFKEEMSKLDEEIKEIQNTIENLNSNSSDIKTAHDEAKKRIHIYIEERKCARKDYEEMQTKYKQVIEKKDSLKDLIEGYNQQLYNLQSKISDKNKAIEEHKTSVEQATVGATSLSERIETKKLVKSLEAEINSIEKQIQNAQQMDGNGDEITKLYIEKKAMFTKIREDIKKQRTFLNRLKQVLENRVNSTHSFTVSKALRCVMDFNNYLHNRNYNGSLVFNHEEQTLEVNVNPNKAKESQENRDLKSLSGGERSFSTVAFLLSLWSIVESPILFLDEFDVFMDQVNRRFAMELILSSAKDKLNGQYLFLTPQEMGYIKPEEYVSIWKMPDPLRTEREYNE